MQSISRKLAVVSTLAVSMAMFGATGAQAAVIDGTHDDGSEVIATFVNANGDSISLDLGVQVAGLVGGSSYTLPSSVLAFIDAAGGAANVTYGIIAGQTTWREYLTSSALDTFAEDRQLANSVRALWNSSLSGLISGLNLGDETSTSENLAYGPFLAGSGSPNYLDGLHDNWQSGDYQFSNMAPGTDPLYLYSVVFSSANLGFAAIESFDSLLATLDLSAGLLNIGSTTVVPVPAAVWLFASAMGLLGFARRRSTVAA